MIILKNKVIILNVQVDNFSTYEAIKRIEVLIKEGKLEYLVTLNVDHI